MLRAQGDFTMKYASFLASIAFALAAIPTAVAQNRSAAAPTRAEQLQVMADFFVPRALHFAIGREMCDTAFRTSLMADPALPEVEQRLPGIIDRMVKASSAQCDVEMRKVLETRQDQVRSDIAAQIPPADLPRLARLFAPSVQEARDSRVEVRPGDTMLQIIARIGATPEQEQRLRAAQVAFARTPGGVALVNKVYAYQGTIRPLLEQDQKAFLKIAADAHKIAHREANLYAQQNGVRELYSDAPVPPLLSAASGADNAGPPDVKLPGSLLYIYSFLDVRETEFTPKVLDQFDAALTARLGALKVSSKILRYNKIKQDQGEFVANNTSVGSDSRMIPVAQTIDRNLADERAAQARYRLIVFPANFETAGAWRFYEIRFILMDTADNRRAFEYVYKGKHMVMWKNSENADARSKKILDAAFVELQAKGFF
jgi:hypothetical protein